MLLAALNNARLYAEQSHDLENCYGVMDLVVDEVSGADLKDATMHGDAETGAAVKIIDDMGLFNDVGQICPVHWQRVKQKRDSQLRRQELYDEDSLAYRVPSDAEWSAQQSRRRGIYVYGQKVYTNLWNGNVGTTHTIGIEGQFWLPEYTDETEEADDIFLLRGSNYLFWQGICELNFINRKFAPREEGNVQPPTREAAAALSAFLTWDTYSQVEGRRRSSAT